MAVDVKQGAATDGQRNGSAADQWVFMAEDAPATNRDLLGGKGAGLAAMTQAGLPGSAGLHDHDGGVQRVPGALADSFQPACGIRPWRP